MADKTIIELDNQITAELQDRLVIVDMNALNTNNIAVGNLATSMFNAGLPITASGILVNGDVNISGDIYANNFVTSSTLLFTGSTNHGTHIYDTHTFTGSVRITGSLNTIGNSTITGSFLVSGSTIQIGNNTLLGNTQLYGNIDVSGSTNFHNHTITMTGSMYTSGSQIITGSLDINGNVNVASGSEFYLAGNKLFNYGQFSDTTTQSGSANTAYSMKFNTTDLSHNVSIVSGSRITVANTGLYNLQFSAQLDNSSNTNELVDIWFAVTGSNVANSNTQLAINKAQAGNFGKVVAAWNLMLPLSASNYVEIKWSTTNSSVLLSATGSASNPTRPSIPSVIATLTQIA
jgi:predicted acyltransferase (DUF342 family)